MSESRHHRRARSTVGVDAARVAKALLAGLATIAGFSGCTGASGTVAGDAPTQTVRLALDVIPESVRTLGVFVVDPAEDEVVASATVSADVRTILLGVPAEVPLRFSVVAWTDRPGPGSLARMPAFFGAALRTISLGQKRETVAVTVLPAGVLTLDFSLGAAVDGDDVIVRVASQRPDVSEASIQTFTVREGLRRSLILPAGRAQITVIGDAGEIAAFRPAPADGFTVRPEAESVAPVTFVPRLPELGPAAPATLEISGEMLDGTGSSTLAGVLAPGSRLVLRGRALDVLGDAVAVPGAVVQWTARSVPAAALVDADGAQAGFVDDLPFSVELRSQGGTARVRLTLQAVLPNGRTLRTQRWFNVAEGPAGPAVDARLVVLDPDALATGTDLVVEMSDARGLYAQDFIGQVDFSESEPWLVLEPRAEFAASARGTLLRPIQRASGPRARSVVLEATVTASVTGLTWTSTMALPVLALD